MRAFLIFSSLVFCGNLWALPSGTYLCHVEGNDAGDSFPVEVILNDDSFEISMLVGEFLLPFSNEWTPFQTEYVKGNYKAFSRHKSLYFFMDNMTYMKSESKESSIYSLALEGRLDFENNKIDYFLTLSYASESTSYTSSSGPCVLLE